ncbi:MAG: substrate-binding domain-containing protein [Candidatus Sumerlaeaceae bacterium]
MASVPRYEKLMQLLREKMTSGEFKVGDRFFSQNVLMKKYALSFATVTRAMNELEREGLLVREQGRGTFVRSLPNGRGGPESQERRVAVFLPWDARIPSHVNFQRLYRGLEAARPAHYNLKMIPYSNDPADLEPFLFSRERVDGIIFVYPGDQHLGFVETLCASHPVVVVGRTVDSGKAGFVYSNNADAAELAVSHLIHSGHRTIAMISGALEMTDSRERLEGYRRALANAEIPYLESLVAFTHPVELNGYGATFEVFEKNPEPEITAIFAAGDVIALGTLAAARTMGKCLPDELSVMGFDDMDAVAELDPPLTTIHIPIEELAGRAMSMLVAQIGGAEPTGEMLPALLVERMSVKEVEAPAGV